jgi:hypothetical protein
MPIPERITIYKKEESIMNKFIKKIFGIDQNKPDTEAERIAKLSPKQLATERKEPWVAVLDTHVNKDNIRNGFFELDWNEYFVMQLKSNGFTGDSEEEIVDQWFSELCRNVGAEEGIDMSRRGSGYVNRALRDDGKTEVY